MLFYTISGCQHNILVYVGHPEDFPSFVAVASELYRSSCLNERLLAPAPAKTPARGSIPLAM